jgi:viologen exporter family transport system permease protein
VLLIQYARASFSAQAQYPGSALLATLGHFLTTGLELLAMWALFDRFGSVGGWHLGEVALFYALVNIQFTIADLLCRGFDVLGSELIKSGAFDRLLLRPRSLTLQLMGHALRVSRFGRLAQALIVMWLATERAPIHWSLANVALALWAIAGGAALFIALLVLQGALSIFTVESLEVVNVLTYGGVQAGQYPLALYGRWFRRLLTFVVPLGCVAYYPALGILGKADPLGAPLWTGALSPLCGFVFLALALAAWRLAVRHYTSTGS